MPEKFHPIIPLSNGKSGLSDKLKTTTTKTTTIVFVCTFKSTQYRPFTNVYSGSRFQVSFLVLFVMLTKQPLFCSGGCVLSAANTFRSDPLWSKYDYFHLQSFKKSSAQSEISHCWVILTLISSIWFSCNQTLAWSRSGTEVKKFYTHHIFSLPNWLVWEE